MSRTQTSWGRLRSDRMRNQCNACMILRGRILMFHNEENAMCVELGARAGGTASQFVRSCSEYVDEQRSDVKIIACTRYFKCCFLPLMPSPSTPLTCGITGSPQSFGRCLRYQASAPEPRQPHRPNRLAPSAVAPSRCEQRTGGRDPGDAIFCRPERSPASST